MKKRILITLFTFAFLALQSAGTAMADLRAEPVATGPQNQRDKFQTDLFTGSAGYSYPIKVPKGTNNLTPEVSLSYESSGTHDVNSKFGTGWDLNRDYIQRNANYTPGDTSDDNYKMHFQGSLYDLVYNPTDSLFHTKIESHLKIQQFLSGGQGSTGMYWQVTTTDGTVYRFGYTTDAEQICNGRNYDYQWNIDQVTDMHDNHIYYTYTVSNGYAYPSQIKYNNDQSREIDFTYTTNPYQRLVYLQGCGVTETNRLSSIQVKTAGSLIHEYDLSFNQATNNQSLLNLISEKGNDGTSTLPATTFSYNPEIQSWQTTYGTWINDAPVDVHLDSADMRLIDVNGDGLADIVKTVQSGGSDTWKVLLNTGSSWSTTYQIWINNAPIDSHLDGGDTMLIDVNGDGLPDIVKTVQSGGSDTWKVLLNTGTSWETTWRIWINDAPIDSHIGDLGTTMMDVNGDGLTDIVKTIPSGGSDTWKVLINTGSSWSTTYQIWINDAPIDSHLADAGTRLADVNGDGLPDIVKTVQSGGSDTWKVLFNLGNSWQTTWNIWIDNAPIDSHLAGGDTVLSDVNGDGLPDIVKTVQSGGSDTWKVLLNLGNSWQTTWNIWIDNAPTDSNLQMNDVRVSDVNGDGLPDIVKSIQSGGSDTWRVWLNNGYAPDLLSHMSTSNGGSIQFNYGRSTQYQNTALPFAQWVVQQMTVNNGLTNSQQTNDVTTYSYKNGLYNGQEHEFRGFGEVDTTEPDGSKKQYIFNQDSARKGKLASFLIMDASNNNYAKTEETWSNDFANGFYSVNLISEKHYTYDGSVNTPKIVETDYQYDNYGNVTKKSELGDTSVTGDERYTYNEYTYNPNLWIVNKLWHTAVKATDDTTTVSQLWKYYDNDPYSTPSANPLPLATSFGDGSDGDLSILTNTTGAPIDSSVTANAGDNFATVGIGLGFSPNQLVLLHQTQGTNAGVWEFARVQGYSGITLTFTNPLTHAYSSSGSDHAQIIVVPQYHNVTVSSGATWTAKAWNGTTGGILAFIADGTVTVDGAINATGGSASGINAGAGGGFRGTTHSSLKPGFQGEGTTGPGGTQINATNGNGGGGGGNNNGTTDAGGGGGGNANTGNTGTGNTGGVGGNAVGTADLTSMDLGGAGGSGGSGTPNTTGAGGNGGGIIFITGATISLSGAINTNGGNGGSSTNDGGGGGAGGSILLRTQTATLGSALVTGVGGSGGSGSLGNGGAGSVGRIRVEYETAMTGSTNPAESILQSSIPLLPAPVAGTSSNNANLIKGDLTKEVKWLSGGTNPETNYSYDSFGNVASVTDANNHTTTTAYDTTGTYPISQTNAKNQISTTNYDLGTGNLLSKTDPNNLTTAYEYDVFGRITKEIRPYDSSNFPTTSYQYFDNATAPQGTLVSKRTVSGQASTIDAYTYVDGLGRKIQTRVNAEDPTKQIVTDTFYDPNGQVFRQTVPYLGSAGTNYATPDTNAKFTEMTYDALGRVTIAKNTKGDSKTTAFDHWKETTIDENGHIKRVYKNADDKIVKVEEVNGVDTYTTTYTYDPLDQLTRITDNSGNNFDFTYDTLGRRTSQVDPDMGTWTYTYDGVDNLLTQKDNRNITTSYTYDELNRKTKIDYPTDADTTYTYDGNGKIGTFTSVVDKAGTINYSYDDRLRKTAESRVIDGSTWTTQFAYDDADRLTSRTNPDNTVEAFTFNNQGEIDSLTGVLNNVDYNAQGKITKKDFANGVTTNYTYNTDDFRLARIQSGTLLDNNYTYDKVGNVLSITDNLLTKTQQFGYDDLDRLITASESAGYNYSYAYNPIGNLTQFTKDGTPIDYTYGLNAGPHALTGSTEDVVVPTPEPTPTPTPTATPTPTPGAGITFRAAVSGNNGAGGTTLTINKPAGTTSGDLMVAHMVVHTSGNVITPPVGWNLILRKDTAVDIATATYWKAAGASEPASYTWTFGTSGEASGGIGSYVGVDNTTPVDASNAQYNSGTSTASNTGVTTTSANDLLVYAVGVVGATTVNTPAGFTERWDVKSNTITTSEESDKIQVATGATGTISTTHNGGSVSNITQLVALKPATVGVETNIALQQPVTVDSTYSTYVGSNAVDGVISDTSRWVGSDTAGPHWIEIDFGGSYTIDRWELANGYGSIDPISNFVLQSWNGSSWIDIPGTSTTGNTNIDVTQVFTTPVLTSKVRLYSTDNTYVRVKEIKIYTPDAVPTATPTLTPTPTSTPTPTPTPTPTNNIYEAENATLSGAVVATNQSGYSGTGFADYINTTADYVEWTVNATASASHTLTFRQANGSTAARPLELKVNGTVVNASLSFPVTGAWNAWSTVSQSVPLLLGTNTVRLTAIGSSGPNMDYLQVTQDSITPTTTPTPTPTPTPAPTYTGSGTATPATISEGNLLTLNASFTNTSSYTNTVRIHLEIRNPTDQQVYSRDWTTETFTAGQTKNYSTTWTIPAGSAQGSYLVKGGATDSTMSTWYLWSNNLGSFTVSSVTPTPIPTPTAIVGGTYKLININSNKALDVASSGTADGTNVQIWTDNGTGAQRWQVSQNSNGTYKLINTNSGKALDVTGAGTTDGTNVEIYTDNGGSNQSWNITQNTDGTYKLIDSNSGKALDVSSAGTSDGTNVQIYTDNGSGAQKWQLTPISSTIQATVTKQTATGTDDAEEFADGTMYTTSTDLELTCDTTTTPCPSNDLHKQTIGMRFAGLAIPKGATITSAYIEFTADEAQSETTNLTFNGQAADNAAAFTTTASNISSRPKTTASVAWNSLPAWTVGTKYQTPSLTAIMQEIVNRSGWASGNAASIIVTGLGHRTAVSYEGGSASAPKLVVTFTTLGSLLSQGKSITASTQKTGYEATKANDGVVVGSYWEAASNTYPSTLTVDLGATHTISKVVMKLDWGTRIENIEIQGSTDNTTFTTIIPAENYSIGTVPVTFPAVNTRYVRLKVNSNNSAAAAQMAEFEVWGL